MTDRVPEAVRLRVAARARHACEYCGVPEDYCPDPMCVEHVSPRAAGGSGDPDNLAWACHGCNGSKYTAVEAKDPATGRAAPLFNPRTDRWDDHYTWSSDFTILIGKTPTGRATVARLRLNRIALVNIRRSLCEAGRHPPAARDST